MKSLFRNTLARPGGIIALAVAAALSGGAAHAAGTLSGTSINNTANLTFSVGGTTQTPIVSNTATFLVDNKVNLTVAEVGGGATVVVADPSVAVTALTTFTVTNNGNTTQDFSLVVANLGSGTANPFGGAILDNYTAGSCTVSNIVIVGGGSMGLYTAADQHINALIPDSSATVTVSCTTPPAQANNSLAVISLTATARTNDALNTLGGVLTNNVGQADLAMTVQTVFADVAGSDDLANAANHSARDAYLVQTAVLSVAKVATLLCDPFNGSTFPKNIPLAYVQYAITISNTGSAAATLSQVTDTLQTELTWDPLLISGAGVAANCAAGSQSLSTTGFGALRGTGATTYAAPGSATQNVTAGATVSGQLVTITFSTLAGTAYGTANASLPTNSFVTVYFNVFVQ